MLVDGFLLAGLTLGAAVLTFRHMPRWCKGFVEKHPGLTRAACFVLTYIVLGHSVTAIFAAAILDILLSILLSINADAEAKPAMLALLERIKAVRSKVMGAIVRGMKTSGVAKMAGADAPQAASVN